MPGPFPAPHLGPPLGVGEIDERLPGEERVAHERHGPLHPWLVLRATHPGRIDVEAAAWAYSTNAWFNRGASGSASSTTADRLSGITVANTPPKNAHAASNPSITSWVV